MRSLLNYASKISIKVENRCIVFITLVFQFCDLQFFSGLVLQNPFQLAPASPTHGLWAACGPAWPKMSSTLSLSFKAGSSSQQWPQTCACCSAALKQSQLYWHYVVRKQRTGRTVLCRADSGDGQKAVCILIHWINTGP